MEREKKINPHPQCCKELFLETVAEAAQERLACVLSVNAGTLLITAERNSRQEPADMHRPYKQGEDKPAAT